MATTIITKNGSGAPLAGDLQVGELAIDLTNKKLYSKEGTTVFEVGATGGGASGTFTDLTATNSFTSVGIDDNATSTAITIDSSQNVGIGTTSPSALLDVSSSDPSIFLTDETAGAGYGQIRYNGGAFIFDADAGGATGGSEFIRFNVSGTEAMRIDSSGRVGIGTTSPSALLTVSSSSNTEINIIDGTRTSQIFTQNGGRDLQIQANQDLIINASGGTNVGIGTSSPSNKLEVNGATGIRADGGGYLTKFLNSSSTAELSGYIYDNDQDHLQITAYDSSYDLSFGTNNAERMRIDSSGNLLVGSTTLDQANNSNTANCGINLLGSGIISGSTNNATTAYFNRLGGDGEIVSFRKDGTTIGSIASHSSVVLGINLRVTTNKSGLRGAASSVIPWYEGADRDNELDVGTASARWDDIYATNGTIQTSDVNEKQDIEALSEAETRVAVAAKGLLSKFRWKSAVEEKGDEARIHFGIIAQNLQAAFEAEGLDAGRYGMFIHSTWTDEETGEERSRMGVRYSELLAFIIAAI